MENGAGVAEDKAGGVGWYEKAAAGGHLDAMYNLGVCLENGAGVWEGLGGVVRRGMGIVGWSRERVHGSSQLEWREGVRIVSYDGAQGCGSGWGRGAKGCVLRW